MLVLEDVLYNNSKAVTHNNRSQKRNNQKGRLTETSTKGHEKGLSMLNRWLRALNALARITGLRRKKHHKLMHVSQEVHSK